MAISLDTIKEAARQHVWLAAATASMSGRALSAVDAAAAANALLREFDEKFPVALVGYDLATGTLVEATNKTADQLGRMADLMRHMR